MSDLRLAVVRDSRAEGWPSMDLCADQLLAHLPTIPRLNATDLEAPFRRRFQRLPVVGLRGATFNADRIVNRHLVLPRFLHTHSSHYDFFHIVDHSYAHAALALPPGRAGVYCHDLDAFRSLLEPSTDPRPWWFRRLARRTLRSLQTAAVVFHSTAAVREQLLRYELVGADRLVHAPYGVSAEFTLESRLVELPSPGVPPGPYLLHVGSHIPRKRIDVLLNVFAAVLKCVPGVRLVQVGPVGSAALAEQVTRLGISSEVLRFSNLTREQLAELYRRAAVVVVPSEAEGFGLPLIEALACGAVVVASDIPVLREVGGDAVVYRPVADVPAWADVIRRVLTEPSFVPPLETRLARAALYSWGEHARAIANAYIRLAESS